MAKKASPAQIAARKAFAAKFGGKKRRASAAENPAKKRRRKRRANPAKAAAPAANPKRRRRRRRSNPSVAARPAANPKRRRRRRSNPRVSGYKRKSTVRGHWRRPAKKSRRRRSNPVTAPATRGITVHTHMHGSNPVRDNPRRRRRRANPAGARPAAANPKRRRRRRSNPASVPYMPSSHAMVRSGMLDNPSYSTLFENPMGAYSTESLKAFGVAATGVGLGLLVARGIDRFVATMKPADSKNGFKANRAWYGKNAVAAINRRPGAVRLGVQAAGAVAGIGAAYALRNKPIAPWLFGGLALGFGSNLLLQFAEWYAIPYVLKIQKPEEQTVQNRLYVLEQMNTQDEVDKIFEDWGTKPALAANQDQNAPIIAGPLNPADSADIATLGRGAAGSRPSSPVGIGASRRFIPDGRIGHCGECGGDGGHYSGCGQCDTCNGGARGRRCQYTVERGVDLYSIANAAGVEVSAIAAMNGGGAPDEWWQPGNQVILPEAACRVVESTPSPEQPTMVAGHETKPAPASSPVAKSVAYALAGGGED